MLFDFLGCFDTDPLQEFLVQIGVCPSLDFDDAQLGMHRFAAHFNLLGFGGNRDVQFAFVTGFHTFHQLVKTSDFRIVKSQYRLELQSDIVHLTESLAVMSQNRIDGDVIVGFCGIGCCQFTELCKEVVHA